MEEEYLVCGGYEEDAVGMISYGFGCDWEGITWRWDVLLGGLSSLCFQKTYTASVEQVDQPYGLVAR